MNDYTTIGAGDLNPAARDARLRIDASSIGRGFISRWVAAILHPHWRLIAVHLLGRTFTAQGAPS
jgi:hypothetical protein